MTTRGMRNNNPGNIRKGPRGMTWKGEIAGSDPSFVTFSSLAYGIRALGAILRNYQETHGLHTVEAMINRWAPPNENQTGTYVANVCRALGVSPSEIFPLDHEQNMVRLVAAICHQENGGDAPSIEDVAAGVSLLFPHSSADITTTH